jgi:hypothetical protein
MRYGICLIALLAIPVMAEPPTIHCPAEPPTITRLQLQERWRIEPDAPDAPLMGFFGSNQVFAHDGRVYMLDSQLCQVQIYSEDGEYLDTIMGEGDGPGEVRDPGAMKLCSGERIGVRHGYPTMIEFVALDGTPVSRWRLQANAWANDFQESPLGWFLVYSASKPNDKPGIFTGVFHAAYHDDDGARTIDLFSEEKTRDHQDGGVTDEKDEFNPWHTAKATTDSLVVMAAARDDYRIEWRDAKGEVTRIVTRGFTAHRRTQAELDRIKYQSYSIVGDDIRFPNRRLCATDPMIHTLKPQPDRSLHVYTSLFEKDLPPNMLCRYEVHGPTGELLERVEIYDPTGDYDVDYDIIALLGEGKAMVLRNLRPAYRAAYDKRMHPEIQKKLPPIPDDRESVDFTPVYCDLGPYGSP